MTMSSDWEDDGAAVRVSNKRATHWSRATLICFANRMSRGRYSVHLTRFQLESLKLVLM